jgi:hypothetical protein
VTWLASHEGPERFVARCVCADWASAIAYLRASALLHSGPSPGLVVAKPDCDLVVLAGPHVYALTSVQ